MPPVREPAALTVDVVHRLRRPPRLQIVAHINCADVCTSQVVVEEDVPGARCREPGDLGAERMDNAGVAVEEGRVAGTAD